MAIIIVSVSTLIIFLILGLILTQFYKRATKETAIVRTGAGGEKVIINGGCIVLPVVHEITKVNLKTLRIKVSRSGTQGLISADTLRVNCTAEFFVRVKTDELSVSTAAQTLGLRTLKTDEIEAERDMPTELLNIVKKMPRRMVGGEDVKPFIVVVLDMLYLGYRYSPDSSLQNQYFYGSDSIAEFLNKSKRNQYFYGSDSIVEFLNKSKRKPREYPFYSNFLNRRNIVSICNQYDRKNLQGVCLAERSPILSIELNPFCSYRPSQPFIYKKNPILRDISFQKILDPYTIYQEISMFIDGILPRQNLDTTELSDETKIAKRGYDKWSFRTKGKNSK